MPEVGAIVNTAGDITEDVRATLDLTTQDGKDVFGQVEIVNDVNSFVRVSNPLLVAVSCGIVAGTVEERDGTCDREMYCRLPLTIIFRIARKREPGSGESDPVRETMRLGEIAKAALLNDRGRGGRTRLIQWGGGVLNGTEVIGDVRPLTRVANEAFFSATMQAACGWIVER
jgi:hypothetical protein